MSLLLRHLSADGGRDDWRCLQQLPTSHIVLRVVQALTSCFQTEDGGGGGSRQGRVASSRGLARGHGRPIAGLMLASGPRGCRGFIRQEESRSIRSPGATLKALMYRKPSQRRFLLSRRAGGVVSWAVRYDRAG